MAGLDPAIHGATGPELGAAVLDARVEPGHDYFGMEVTSAAFLDRPDSNGQTIVGQMSEALSANPPRR